MATYQRRQWQPTPVLLCGKSHGRRSLVGCSPRGCKESDMTKWLLSLFTFMHWRRKWHPTPVLLPGKSHGRRWHPTPVLLSGKSHGWRSLIGCSPWGREESDTTKWLLPLFTFMHWRRKWQPTPVFLPGESQGWGSLMGCCLWALRLILVYLFKNNIF